MDRSCHHVAINKEMMGASIVNTHPGRVLPPDSLANDHASPRRIATIHSRNDGSTKVIALGWGHRGVRWRTSSVAFLVSRIERPHRS